MCDQVPAFYDKLAPLYHLIFEDWNRSIERQGRILDPIVREGNGAGPLRILDCACGIGTQAFGLAAHGHQVTGSDVSQAAVARARAEADYRSLQISFVVSDMTSMAEVEADRFDVVAAFDNALPHLSEPQLALALATMRRKLKPGGLFAASIRDYDHLLLQRPSAQQPAFYGEGHERRIVHQVWDWLDERRYAVHLHLALASASGWQCHHFVSDYRALQRSELNDAVTSAGFHEVKWMMPEDSGFYQPIVTARLPVTGS